MLQVCNNDPALKEHLNRIGYTLETCDEQKQFVVVRVRANVDSAAIHDASCGLVLDLVVRVCRCSSSVAACCSARTPRRPASVQVRETCPRFGLILARCVFFPLQRRPRTQRRPSFRSRPSPTCPISTPFSNKRSVVVDVLFSGVVLTTVVLAAAGCGGRLQPVAVYVQFGSAPDVGVVMLWTRINLATILQPGGADHVVTIHASQ